MVTFNILNLSGENRQALENLRLMPVWLAETLERMRTELIQISLDPTLNQTGKTQKN